MSGGVGQTMPRWSCNIIYSLVSSLTHYAVCTYKWIQRRRISRNNFPMDFPCSAWRLINGKGKLSDATAENPLKFCGWPGSNWGFKSGFIVINRHCTFNVDHPRGASVRYWYPHSVGILSNSFPCSISSLRKQSEWASYRSGFLAHRYLLFDFYWLRAPWGKILGLSEWSSVSLLCSLRYKLGNLGNVSLTTNEPLQWP